MSETKDRTEGTGFCGVDINAIRRVQFIHHYYIINTLLWAEATEHRKFHDIIHVHIV
jgi:hypothetical protein